MENNRNTIIFFVLAIAVLIGYETLVMGPAERRKDLEAKQAAALQQKMHPGAPLVPGAAPQTLFVPRDKALVAAPRVPVDTPSLVGSIDLKGGRIDDLKLKGYRETIDPKSPLVELFNPEGAQGAYFAQTGWTGPAGAGLPDANTVWTAPAGASLAPGRPVALTYTAPNGLAFVRTIAVDDKYMFTVTDEVANHAADPLTLASYGSVQRQCVVDDKHKDPCLPDGAVRANAHEGSIGWLAKTLKTQKYRDWYKKSPDPIASTGGWLGITDKYWMAALAPQQDQAITANFHITAVDGVNVFEANFVGPAQKLPPGGALTATNHIFAGAKVVPVLKGYQQSLGIPELDQAVDWGLFWFLTRPLFVVVEFFYQNVPGHNFGVAILLLTVCARLAFFPLANKSYESMTRMKKVQPQLAIIKKQHEKDPQKYQQEMMALYQREKINPFGGCLPLLLQIPVFLALYKVLSVTLEMRHAAFFGWVHDLSARDPTTFANLFGLLPFDPSALPVVGVLLAGALHIGIWPLIYVVTMWLTMSMSPQTGMDPSQQAIMRFMPLIFMFSISGVAVGLVIYWAWSNVLSIIQQYIIMRRFQVDNPIDDIIRRLSGKPAPAQ